MLYIIKYKLNYYDTRHFINKRIIMKYIVITGGVISGIGKGITSSSIGLLLKRENINVTMIKIDPYLNVSAGTMSPYEHGECYVLDDGSECDLDLGNYERFLNIKLTKHHSITTGRIYQTVINKELRGEYNGETVQVVPHITNEIISQIKLASQYEINNKTPEVCIIEVGGTIGDIEGLPFIEAILQMSLDDSNEFCFVHVAMALNTTNCYKTEDESNCSVNNFNPKTKPIQHSLSMLRSRGIMPDILVVRADNILSQEIKQKIHKLCHIPVDHIISNPNVPNIYNVPRIFNQQDITQIISKKLNFNKQYNIPEDPYKSIVLYFNNKNKLPCVNLGIIGKYSNSQGGKSPDTYLSLIRAIEHASYILNINTNIKWIDSENVDCEDLQQYNGFIIPGGFGYRGCKGKLKISEYARTHKIPILGICLGMQIMVVDCYNNLSNNLLSYSKEWEDMIPESKTYIIDILPDQTNIIGGTMRLGSYKTKLNIGSQTNKLYNTNKINERHRHRYEVNNQYLNDIEKTGLKFVGKSKLKNGEKIMEICELENHPFFIGCQFHPEFQSYVYNPHPLFVGLLQHTYKHHLLH